MPRALPPVQCDSPESLERALRPIRELLALPETEESWDKIAQGITRLTSLTQNGATDFPQEFATALRSLSRPLNSAIASERSRLSGVAIDLLKELGSGLGRSFDPLLPVFLPPLLTLCARTSKVFVSRARACIVTIIDATHSPAILTYLSDCANDKSVSLRLTVAESALACLNSFNPPDLERETRAREVEGLIKSAATDASAEVRKCGRKMFDAYRILLPQRVDSFTAPLSPTTRKYLDISNRPPSVTHSNPSSSRPTSSQSMQSVHTLTRPKSTIPPSKSSHQLPVGAQNHNRTTSSSSMPVEGSRSRTKSTISTANRDTAFHRSGPTRPPPDANPPSRHPSSKDMPPPDFIPSRPARVPRTGESKGPQRIETAVPSSTSEAAFRSTSPAMLSEPALPSRMVRSATAPSVALRPASNEAQSSAAAVREGPIRPLRVGTATQQPQRVVGGARRVLLPEMVPPDKVETPDKEAEGTSASEKPERDDAAAAPRIARSSSKAATAATSSTAVPPERPPFRKAEVAKTQEKAKPVPAMSRHARSASVSQPASKPMAAKPLAKAEKSSKPPTAAQQPSRSAAAAQQPMKPTAKAKAADPSAATAVAATSKPTREVVSRVNEPTLSQLARTKVAAAPTGRKAEAAAAVKPAWGRPGVAVNKTGAAAKTAVVSRKQGPAANAKANAKPKTLKVRTEVVRKPEHVPLPPSPGESLPPALVALPPSPTPPEEAQVEQQVEEVPQDDEEDTDAPPQAEGEEADIDVPPQDDLAQMAREDDVHHEAFQDSPGVEETPCQENPAEDDQHEDARLEAEIEEPISQPFNEISHVAEGDFILQPSAESTPIVRISPGTPDTMFAKAHPQLPAETPITALLTSIQRGFMFSPASPLSPAQGYLNRQQEPDQQMVAFGQVCAEALKMDSSQLSHLYAENSRLE